MDSLLVGIRHSVDCNGALDASPTLTCGTTPLPIAPTLPSGQLRRNGGRHQIGMLDGIKSEHWTPSAQNTWTASVRIRIHAAVRPLGRSGRVRQPLLRGEALAARH